MDDKRKQDRESRFRLGADERAYAGRLAAKLFWAAGALTIVNNNIPPVEHLNLPVLYGVGFSALLVGTACWLAPWRRLPSLVALALGPLALAHIGVGNLFGGVSAYSFAVYFVVVFVYIGMTQPPLVSLLLAPPAAVAYVVPALLQPDAPAVAALSATVAIPVCVLVGEVIARATSRQKAARAESDRRAELLGTVARASRSVNSLETSDVLRTVVDAAVSLGFQGGEIRVFDESADAHASLTPVGASDAYAPKQPIDSGLAGEVRRRGETVVVDDYSSWAQAVSGLRPLGTRTVIGSPVWSEGRVVAALIAGTRQHRHISSEEIEAFELLAIAAGRALENARRFATERQAVERLAELDQLKGDFLSNVSHELRTPLTVIEGVGRTLQAKWKLLDDDMRDDLLRRLNRNSATLVEIISNLLDFSRLEAGRLKLDNQPVELRALCESVVGRVRPLFDGRNLHVDVAAAPTVMGDPMLLERVIENLLSNAARHTPAGTTVWLQVERRTDGVTLAVADDGPGIPEEDVARLGERFFRSGATGGAVRGTGLGLAFSREILKLHGSALEVENQPGAGARFSFVLPVESLDGVPSDGTAFVLRAG